MKTNRPASEPMTPEQIRTADLETIAARGEVMVIRLAAIAAEPIRTPEQQAEWDALLIEMERLQARRADIGPLPPVITDDDLKPVGAAARQLFQEIPMPEDWPWEGQLVAVQADHHLEFYVGDRLLGRIAHAAIRERATVIAAARESANPAGRPN